MSDVKIAYDQVLDFMNSTSQKTLLLRGIADKEKHQILLKALNAHGYLKGLVYLIHTTRDGMNDFFRWAGLYKVKVPKKYGQGMKLSNLTIYFDNLNTKNDSEKYDDYTFDFMIIWPIASVTKNENEIQMLKEMTKRQKSKKIIFLSLKEPWYNPDPFETFVDRVIKLDCENDDPTEYQRIYAAYEDDMKRYWY